MSLAIPSVGLATTDWWAAEIMIIIAGTIGTKELTAMIVIANIGGMMNRFGLGMDQAACTLIGQQIGAGNLSEAKSYFHLSAMITLALVLALGGMYYHFRADIVSLYISDEVLHSFIVDVIWLMCLNTVPEVFKGYLKGVMKALAM